MSFVLNKRARNLYIESVHSLFFRHALADNFDCVKSSASETCLEQSHDDIFLLVHVSCVEDDGRYFDCCFDSVMESYCKYMPTGILQGK